MTIHNVRKIGYTCFVELGSGEETHYYEVCDCSLKIYYLKFATQEVFGEHGHDDDRITFIRSGKAKLFFRDSVIDLFPGDSLHIEPNTPHRIEVVGEEPISLIEFVISKRKSGE